MVIDCEKQLIVYDMNNSMSIPLEDCATSVEFLKSTIIIKYIYIHVLEKYFHDLDIHYCLLMDEALK